MLVCCCSFLFHSNISNIAHDLSTLFIYFSKKISKFYFQIQIFSINTRASKEIFNSGVKGLTKNTNSTVKKSPVFSGLHLFVMAMDLSF